MFILLEVGDRKYLYLLSFTLVDFFIDVGNLF